ncbi:hypothetical protein TRVL_06251 [Trypanosoma vivax]|nr:hypothetical protein TRVL_06251 [Trypanosoma vivax]
MLKIGHVFSAVVRIPNAYSAVYVQYSVSGHHFPSRLSIDTFSLLFLLCVLLNATVVKTLLSYPSILSPFQKRVHLIVFGGASAADSRNFEEALNEENVQHKIFNAYDAAGIGSQKGDVQWTQQLARFVKTHLLSRRKAQTTNRQDATSSEAHHAENGQQDNTVGQEATQGRLGAGRTMREEASERQPNKKTLASTARDRSILKAPLVTRFFAFEYTHLRGSSQRRERTRPAKPTGLALFKAK